MSNFHPLPRADRRFLVGILLFAVLPFLPLSRDVSVAGLALMAWLLAALMVLAPVIALMRIVASHHCNR